MKPKQLMLIVVAVACGLVAMVGVQQAMNNNAGPAPEKVETAKVLVALTEIGQGERLTEDNAVLRELPVSSLPEDPITKPDQWAERAAKVPMYKGDIIRQAKLGEKGAFGEALTIPKGMRVMTISVNDSMSQSSMLKAGDRVDVIVTFDVNNGRGVLTRTKPLLEYVQVFATDNRTAGALRGDKSNQGGSKTAQLSLLVTHEQVEYVTLANKKGTLSISWRNPQDTDQTNSRGIDSNLLSEMQSGNVSEGKREPEPEPEKPAPVPVAVTPPAVPVPEPKLPDANVTPKSVLDFLQQTEAAAVPAPRQVVVVQPPSAPPPPPRPKWTMKIYVANKPEIAEFDLPEPEVKEEEQVEVLESPASTVNSTPTPTTAPNMGENPVQSAMKWLLAPK